uniref:Uncharacterized protein n=1 Tax=Chromera velia CCMP2878 TaxID=1169474 RepID=A0A0G4FIQ1_9ALVE|eukprot:Cvel_17059.t1-p1 / transcript=Cvel_17059.t1 / gene=Cvel_17059 / organism=Chromera_velia_CCMP2878 / gene_product=Ras-related protein RABF1, putative / transcript_product=Ras-related protein RABF1, putative / location=Cvel_scaffold1344:12972-14695(-) / protein_length=214 / sequence_SO=supercontig / SO=protein_coding / is_pseudo=false
MDAEWCALVGAGASSSDPERLRYAQGGDGANRKGGGGEGGSMDAKIVLLGDSGVGKSSLALRFCQGRFTNLHEVTIGAAFLQQLVRLPDGKQLKIHLWDTGGQERFRAMIPLYYRDAAGAVIVYDCSHAPSWQAVKFWVQELREKGPPDCCLAVAANKCDVSEWEVDAEEAREFCRQNDMTFVECSAKSGENVGRLFEVLASRIHQQINRKGGG